MDKKKKRSLAHKSIRFEDRDQRYIVGIKQLRKSLISGSIQEAVFAEDADPYLIDPLTQLCMQCNVPYSFVRSMSELGALCGIEVGAAAAGLIRLL